MCGSATLFPKELTRRLSISRYACAYKRQGRKKYKERKDALQLRQVTWTRRPQFKV